MSANPKMKECPECKNMVVEVAAACKYCGYIFNAPAEIEKPAVIVPPKTASNKPILIALLVIAAIAVVVVILSGGGKDSGPTPTGAVVMCQEFVKDRLKAPSSAKFQSISDARVKKDAENMFTVLSYVEAQNSFGAMMRTDYICQVSYSGDGNWRLTDLQMP